MTYRELIAKIDDSYPDGLLGRYADEWDTTNAGDPLARFIAREIYETFDEEASDQEKLDEALRVIDTSTREIAAVRDRLRELAKGVAA